MGRRIEERLVEIGVAEDRMCAGECGDQSGGVVEVGGDEGDIFREGLSGGGAWVPS